MIAKDLGNWTASKSFKTEKLSSIFCPEEVKMSLSAEHTEVMGSTKGAPAASINGRHSTLGQLQAQMDAESSTC